MPEGRLGKHLPVERMLRWVTLVKPGEWRSVLLLLLQVFLLLLAYYLIRPVREALILDEGSPEVRSYAIGAISITLIFMIPLYKLLFDHLDGNGNKSALLRWVMSFFISNLLIFAILGKIGVPVSLPFFVWGGVFSVMVLAQFWAFAADLFNIKTGQRLFTVIAIGSALGSVVGSQLASFLFPMIGPFNLMLLAAFVLSLVIWIGSKVERLVPASSQAAQNGESSQDADADLKNFWSSFNVVLRNRYLLLIAIFVAMLNLVNSTGGYILASFVHDYAAREAGANLLLTERDLIGQFYGDYLSWVTLIQLALQIFVVSKLFRNVGVSGAILIVPLIMIINYGLIAFVPVFSIVRIMMIIENGSNYSIQTTVNHSLYLTTTRQEKYVGKTTVDTFFWRFGDLLHAALIFVLANLFSVALTDIMVINFVLSLCLFMLSLAIGRHYRNALRQNHRQHSLMAESISSNVYAPSGQILVFSVPDEVLTDSGETSRYKVRIAGGGKIPEWIRFDPTELCFTVNPPLGSVGCVDLELLVTDSEGLWVCSRLRIEHGADSKPRFSDDLEGLWHAG